MNDPLELIRKYGRSSMSFLSLYGDYRWFVENGIEGALAYVDCRTAWIAASDPLCAPSDCKALLEAFAKRARASRRAVALLPASPETRHATEAVGYSSLQIGSEPWIRLQEIDSTLTQRSIAALNESIERFDPRELPYRENTELDSIRIEWLKTRRMATLGFLNRVEPWKLPEHRRYFRLIERGKTQAFIAAAPVTARNGWYLVDIIRRPKSPQAATAQLVHQTLRLLRDEGAREATLGFSPLAGLDSGDRRKNPLIHRLLRLCFERGGWLYGFKSLYQFKQKFGPAHWEPRYLLFYPPRLGPRILWGLYRAIFPQSLLNVAFVTGYRSLRGFFRNQLQRATAPRIVLRGLPKSFRELLYRIKATLTLAAFNLLVFLVSTNRAFRLRDNPARDFPYQWDRWLGAWHGQGPLRDWILPAFLHWDLLHMGLNLLMLGVFCTLLEIWCGSALTLSAFLIGTLFANPLTTAWVGALLSAFRPESLGPFLADYDIGASLGIFACLGALVYFLKRRRLGSFSVLGVSFLYSWTQQSLLSLNHVTAFVLGQGLARLYVPEK